MPPQSLLIEQKFAAIFTGDAFFTPVRFPDMLDQMTFDPEAFTARITIEGFEALMNVGLVVGENYKHILYNYVNITVQISISHKEFEGGFDFLNNAKFGAIYRQSGDI